MKLLPRTEEVLLLAVWRLQDEAYAVAIRDHLFETMSKSWSFGALFVVLERMVKKGYLTSYLAPPTPTRGGRSKRIYQLTATGKQALVEIRLIEEKLWTGITGILPDPQAE